MKIIVSILSLLNGGYMLADGIFVLLKGKYIGPAKPGPWSKLFTSCGINVFNLGPLFILFGLCWLVFLAGLWLNQSWAYLLGIVISVLTLWYLPFGTFISLILLILLIIAKQKLRY